MHRQHFFSRWIRVMSLVTPFMLVALFLSIIHSEHPNDSFLQAVMNAAQEDRGLLRLIVMAVVPLYTFAATALLLSSRVTVTAQGVQSRVMLKKSEIAWGDMKQIGIIRPSGISRRVSFSTVDAISGSVAKTEHIACTYSSQLIDVVRRYWDKPIWGINDEPQQDNP